LTIWNLLHLVKIVFTYLLYYYATMNKRFSYTSLQAPSPRSR